jgi:hypothetical protein
MTSAPARMPSPRKGLPVTGVVAPGTAVSGTVEPTGAAMA